MPNDDYDPFEGLDEIPFVFDSLEFDGPFTKCTQCSEPVRTDDGTFQLQKAMKRGEPILEFALCEHCHMELIESFSESTTERLESYFEEHASEDLGIDACIFCSIPRRELEEFNLSGHCISDRLIIGTCICIDCLLGLQPLISKETRDSRNRFMERNFPGVPADSKRPVLV